jgi:hypothetical protein
MADRDLEQSVVWRTLPRSASAYTRQSRPRSSVAAATLRLHLGLPDVRLQLRFASMLAAYLAVLPFGRSHQASP